MALAIIDLTKSKIVIDETSESLKRSLLGGRGLNMHYLLKFLKPGTDPLSPDNVLIFGTGLLSGTLVPNSSRFNVTAKSPETGFLGDANCGGFFSAELRYAGFDRIIVLGKSPEPVYIRIDNGKIDILPARDYWGLDTQEVQQQFMKEHGKVVSAVCGVAGEKLVRFACVRTGVKNSAGRGGMGAVMGSKNLKAVVVSGDSGIPIADPEGLLVAVEEIKDYIMESKIISILGKVGTPLLYDASNALGAIRTKNSQLNVWSENLNASEIEKCVEKMISCSSCIVHCRHRNTLGGEGPEYSTVGLLGANLGLDDVKQVIELNNLCNDFGLDTSSTGTILGWAYELYEKGIINREETGEELAFGDFELTKRLIRQISRREGFGDILAESTRNVERWGPESQDYLIAVKGLPQSDPHDVRYVKAFALGIATASRGADHLRNRPTLEMLLKMPLDLRRKIYGETVNSDPTSYEGKEHSVYFSDNIFAAIDCLGICKFICHGFNSPHFIDYSRMATLVNAVTGLNITASQIEEAGKRVIDIERHINLREGMNMGHDTLPKRYFDDPMPLKSTKGHHIDRLEFAKMRSRYYELRGWDEKGNLSPERIKELEAFK